MIDERDIARFRERHAAARLRLSDARDRRDGAARAVDSAVKAREFCTTHALAVQSRVHTVIAGLVTRCLHAVFLEPYDFRIEFVKRRNKTEADLYFERGGKRFDYSQVGGGVLDVAAFALRLASLVLRRPPVRKVLILDEPFRMLSGRGGNLERMKNLLLTLSKETGFQFVVVTHSVGFECGKVIKL